MKKNKFKTFLVNLLLMSLPSFVEASFVDVKDADFSHSVVDLKAEGTGYHLQLQRTYHSRSLHRGLFGYGWCSNLESKLVITAESKINYVHCGSGEKVSFTPSTEKSFFFKNVKNIMAMSKKANPNLTTSQLRQLRLQVEGNQFFRNELATRLGMKGQLIPGRVYRAENRPIEKIVFEGGNYKRILSDQSIERYDKKGRLIARYDRMGNYIKIIYQGPVISHIVDSANRRIDLKVDPAENRIVSARLNQTLLNYIYNQEDLAFVRFQNKNRFSYTYDDLHNMKTAQFPDGTNEVINYNSAKDWVTSFKDRAGCIETYGYEASKKDPINDYSSGVKKNCRGKVTYQASYRFVHRQKKDRRGKYLFMVSTNINGVAESRKFDDLTGRPIEVNSNGVVKNYAYNKKGLVSRKSQANKVWTYQYHPTCHKVSEVREQLIDVPKKRSLSSQKVTGYSYDNKKCLMNLAVNNLGQKFKVKYDERGRVAMVIDHTKKLIKISYDGVTTRPVTVKRPGVGLLKLIYNSLGVLQKVQSPQGISVQAQITKIFSNIVDLITPATEGVQV